MASTISKPHNFQLFKLPCAAWSPLALKAEQVYLAHWSESTFYQFLVPGIKGVQFFPSPSSSPFIHLPSFASCLVGLLTAKRCKNQGWKLFIQTVLVSHQWSSIPLAVWAQTVNMWKHSQSQGWADKSAVFSLLTILFPTVLYFVASARK